MTVEWDLSTAQQLARLQMKNIPSPIMRDYEWSGIYAPMEHQKTTAEFLTLNPRAFCFNEQGTGKTAASIWASDYLLSGGYRGRVLIISPLSINYYIINFKCILKYSCSFRNSYVSI